MKKNYTSGRAVKTTRYPFLFLMLTLCMQTMGYAEDHQSAASYNVGMEAMTAAPIIVTNPFNRVICQGGNTFFSIKATNATNYLWQVSADQGIHWATATGGIYTGETTDTLKLTYANDPGKYRCIVTGAGGSDTSTVANLSFFIVEQTVTAQTTQICRGDSATITVGSSQTGINYYLRDAVSTIAGPVPGNGGTLLFSTGAVFATKTYSVLAQKSAVGTALDFDGINDHVKLNGGFAAMSSFTFSAWVYPTNNLTNGKIICSSDFELTITGGGIKFQSATIGTVNYPGIEQDSWTHVTVAYDGTTLHLYLNGTEVKTLATAGLLPAVSSVTLGKDDQAACCYFSGKLDELRMWSKYLTLDEVRAGMSDCIEGTEANLAAYYRFDDGAGSGALSDFSGNNHTGTLTNMDITNDWVMGTSSCGDNLACSRIMLQTPKITMYSIVPSITATNPGNRCAAGVVVLSATATKGNLSWYTSSSGGIAVGTGPQFTTPFLNASTSYFVSSMDQGCTSTRTEIKATIKPMPDITVTVGGPTVTATQVGANYQWVDCKKENQVITGATAISYTATKIGTYAVIIDLNGCLDTSACVAVNTIGIDELTKAIQFTVYPNPSTGNITVHASDAGIFTIINQLGQAIQTLQLNSANNYTVTIENLSNGIYVIMGLKNEQVIAQKIVIKN
jgi:hypothetical protein